MHVPVIRTILVPKQHYVCLPCRLRLTRLSYHACKRFQHSNRGANAESEASSETFTNGLPSTVPDHDAKVGPPTEEQAQNNDQKTTALGANQVYSQKTQDVLQQKFNEHRRKLKGRLERMQDTTSESPNLSRKLFAALARTSGLEMPLFESSKTTTLGPEDDKVDDTPGKIDQNLSPALQPRAQVNRERNHLTRKERAKEARIAKKGAPKQRRIDSIKRKAAKAAKKGEAKGPTITKYGSTPQWEIGEKASTGKYASDSKQESLAKNSAQIAQFQENHPIRKEGQRKSHEDMIVPQKQLDKDASGAKDAPLLVKKGMRRYTKSQTKSSIRTINASELRLTPIPTEQPPVPGLAYGLERALFNPGVYQLQDPRSRVYNFDPYLQNIMPVNEFDFDALKEYITSSRDESLKQIAQKHAKRYVGSTSSMTAMLAHFHYLLSQWRPVNTGMLSKNFPAESRNFTELLRCPSAIFLKYNDGRYAIDADKQFDKGNVLQLLGKSMEKLLVLKSEDYEKYRKSNPSKVPEQERSAPESYHYSGLGDFLMRSQLDAHDPRLPGTGMFDLKTRAVVSIRMDVMNYEHGMGYQIKDMHGAFESYEREYYDMIRAAFLKYSMQVRMGRMDGIFVAYHNTQRIFGFQYISIEDMDLAIHGQKDTSLGDQEFALSVDLLNEVLDRATKKFPKTSIRLHFETRDAATPFMYIFAEPVTDERMTEIQSLNQAAIAEFEKNVFGVDRTLLGQSDEEDDSQWEDMEASVQDTMDKDELGLEQNPDDQVSNTAQIEISGKQDGDKACSEHEDGQSERQEASSDIGIGSSGEVVPSMATPDPRDADGRPAEGQGDDPPHAPPGSKEEAASTVLEDTETTQRTLPSQAEGEEDQGTQADAPFLEEIKEGRDMPAEVLAMTLTLRNKVNGSFTLRPEKLSASDKWSIEYNLAEVSDTDRAWALYQACLTRRKKRLSTMPEEDAEKVNFYIQNLRNMSQQGMKWRRRMDESDASRPTQVLGRDIQPGSAF